MPKNYVIWEWVEGDASRYIGWGEWTTNHPAKRMWAQRLAIESPLHDWLRSHKSEPKRIDHSGIVRYTRDEARTVSAAYRAKRKEDGHQLLDPRPYGTKEGGGAPRQVMGPNMTIFDSVRSAATAVGRNPCTITRWCQTEGTDWDYIT